MMSMPIRFNELSAPFADDEIEWRVMRCGIKNGRPWAQLAPYLTSRGIMNRLDEICGPENWQDKYRILESPEPGVICSLSIWTGDAWITKEDGAGMTRGQEVVKSVISDALKRAAVKFGMGRYLYSAPEVWANNIQDGYPPPDEPNAVTIFKREDGKVVLKHWCPAPKLSELMPADDPPEPKAEKKQTTRKTTSKKGGEKIERTPPGAAKPSDTPVIEQIQKLEEELFGDDDEGRDQVRMQLTGAVRLADRSATQLKNLLGHLVKTKEHDDAA